MVHLFNKKKKKYIKKVDKKIYYTNDINSLLTFGSKEVCMKFAQESIAPIMKNWAKNLTMREIEYNESV